MIKPNLKIIFRAFAKEKAYFLINFCGLSVGIISLLLILGYISIELSYDKYYSNSSKDYRIVMNNNGQEFIHAPIGLGKEMLKEFPEVDAFTSCEKGTQEFMQGEGSIEIPIILSDSNFFKIFNFTFIYGNPLTALKKKNALVITEGCQLKYFHGKNAVGQYIVDKSGTVPLTMEITGVIKDIPINTHFNVEGISSALNEDPDIALSWDQFAARPQYIKLKEGTNVEQLKGKLVSFYTQTRCPKDIKLDLQPVSDIHLHSTALDDGFTHGNFKNIYIFSFAGFLILIIACVNYINLSTARSLSRAKEVGVRKTFGATNGQIAFQFILEAIVFFFLAFCAGVLISIFLWPVFINKLGFETGAPKIFQVNTFFSVIGICIIASILSGAYPAFIISNLKLSNILKGLQKSSLLNINIRKSLIVLQFTISAFLIIATTIAYKQLYLINTIDLGFRKENLIVLGIQRYDLGEGFLNELKRDNYIKNIAVANFNLGNQYNTLIEIKNPRDTTKEMRMAFIDADIDFAKTLNLQIIEGRIFSNDFPSDNLNVDTIIQHNRGKLTMQEIYNLNISRPIVLTEKAVAGLNLKKPIGQILNLQGLQGTVIGIVKDIHGLSLHNDNPMIALRANNFHNYYGYLYIRLNQCNFGEELESIRKKWDTYFPGNNFDFSFADERLQSLYISEEREISIFSIFDFFAIIISCSGLFSLVALSLQQRIKEIGIRKILGASVTQILILVSKEFIALILISFLIAIPIAWFVMNKWLQDFAYRTSLSWWIFGSVGLILVVIGFITISFQAVKAAFSNPVNILRSE